MNGAWGAQAVLKPRGSPRGSHFAASDDAYLASATRAVVTGPSPMIRSVTSSSLAPSQCTRLPKWVTNVPGLNGTARLAGSYLLPVPTHQGSGSMMVAAAGSPPAHGPLLFGTSILVAGPMPAMR